MSKIRLKIDEDLYLKGAKEIYDIRYKKSAKRYIGWFFIALLQIGFVATLKGRGFVLFAFSCILVIYWYFLRWPLRRYFIKSSLKRSPFIDKEIEITLTKNGLSIDKNIIPYENIKDIISTQDGYIIDIKDLFLYIPKSKLLDNSFISELKESKRSVI